MFWIKLLAQLGKLCQTHSPALPLVSPRSPGACKTRGPIQRTPSPGSSGHALPCSPPAWHRMAVRRALLLPPWLAASTGGSGRPSNGAVGPLGLPHARLTKTESWNVTSLPLPAPADARSAWFSPNLPISLYGCLSSEHLSRIFKTHGHVRHMAPKEASFRKLPHGGLTSDWCTVPRFQKLPEEGSLRPGWGWGVCGFWESGLEVQ